MEAAVSGKRTRIYALETFKLKNGTQLPRLHEYFSQTLLPWMSKIHNGPKIFLEALVAPHMPQVAVIYGFASLDEMWSVRTKVTNDSELMKTADALESGPEPAFESLDTTLLEATDYSPEIAIATEAAKPPRLFELRVYHSPTYRQLKALHERFAGPEIRIFHRVGVRPMFYSSTLVGQNLPNLTYLIPFDDLAAREKAWNAFNADPEWVKVRKESIDRSGQIASVIQISLWKATAYSPVK
jgi:NIPSNAP